MPSLGPAEILVILVIALLVFGPDKMPDIARQVGRGFREFRRVQNHLKAELRDVVSEFDSEDTSAEQRAKDNTGTLTPAATGDPIPSLSPNEGNEPVADTPTVDDMPPAAAPPAEVALPPAEPPAENA